MANPRLFLVSSIQICDSAMFYLHGFDLGRYGRRRSAHLCNLVLSWPLNWIIYIYYHIPTAYLLEVDPLEIFMNSSVMANRDRDPILRLGSGFINKLYVIIDWFILRRCRLAVSNVKWLFSGHVRWRKSKNSTGYRVLPEFTDVLS